MVTTLPKRTSADTRPARTKQRQSPARSSAAARSGSTHAATAVATQLARAQPPCLDHIAPTLVLNAGLQVLAEAGGDTAPFLRRTGWRPGERVEVLLQPWLLPCVLRLLKQVPERAHTRSAPLLARQAGRRPRIVAVQLRRDEGLLFLTLDELGPDPGARTRARIGRVRHEAVMRAAVDHEPLDVQRTPAEQAAELEDANDGLANPGIATFVVDAALQLQRFNPSAAALFGFRNADVGQPLARCHAPPDALATQLRQGIEHNASSTFLVHRDGRDLLVQSNLVRGPHQGCTGAIVSCIDETGLRAAERRLERQLRQSQKMQAMSRLTGGIAHDFNNILASIMGYADLLARTLSQPPAPRHARPEDARRYVGEILRASERARRLIQQLLLYSHGGGGVPQPVDVARLIEASLSMLRAALPATIELHAESAGELPRVYIDPAQGHQLLLNLVVNARDAMLGRDALQGQDAMQGQDATRARGRIVLSADVLEADRMRCASCHTDHGGRYLRLRVYDNGPGLEDGTRERVFEPFFTTKDVGQGTGLGLAVVHGVVHEHGGHIDVRSSANGATFDLLFPVLPHALRALGPAGADVHAIRAIGCAAAAAAAY